MAESTATRALALTRSALVWDNHACMPLRPGDDSFLPQLERFRANGADVVCLNVGFGPQSLADHVRMLASFRRWFAAHTDRYALIRTVAEIDRARAAGKMAIFFDVEGMGPFNEGDFGLVTLFRELGVGWMLIAYNRATAAGSGCYDETDGGLTAHGRALVAEMERVGMIVCCSHTGHRTARDVLAVATKPVIFSHSNPSAVHPHTRNIPDDLIRRCAATGGVVGVNGIGIFLGDNDDRPETVAEHVDYVVQFAGVDHVGLALDYCFDQQELADYLATMRDTFPNDPTYSQAIKMVPPEAFPAITAALLDRGYTDADVAKILGGNWRRVAAAVWR